jgi:hypothetical protein
VTRYGVEVTLHEFDALDLDGHAAFVAGLPDLPRVAVCAVGAMGTQEENAASPQSGAAVMRANFEGPASILAHLANAMEARGLGHAGRHLLSRGGTGAGIELCLRLGQGGVHRLPVGPAQPAGARRAFMSSRSCLGSSRQP